jgi:hypothetical protein
MSSFLQDVISFLDLPSLHAMVLSFALTIMMFLIFLAVRKLRLEWPYAAAMNESKETKGKKLSAIFGTELFAMLIAADVAVAFGLVDVWRLAGQLVTANLPPYQAVIDGCGWFGPNVAVTGCSARYRVAAVIMVGLSWFAMRVALHYELKLLKSVAQRPYLAYSPPFWWALAVRSGIGAAHLWWVFSHVPRGQLLDKMFNWSML